MFLTTIIFSPDDAENEVLVSCTLHNYLRTKARGRYWPPSSVDTVSADGVIINDVLRDNNNLNSILHQGTNYYSTDSKQVREGYCLYFNSSQVFVNQSYFAKLIYCKKNIYHIRLRFP